MFLYRQTSRHGDSIMVTEDFDAAVERARSFLGVHNPVDGCSTAPHIELGATRFYGSRSSSFGIRRAYVVALNAEELTVI